MAVSKILKFNKQALLFALCVLLVAASSTHVYAAVPVSGNSLTIDVPYYDYTSGSGVMSNTLSVGDLTAEQVYSVTRTAVGNMVIQEEAYATTTYQFFTENVQGELTYSFPLKLYLPYGLTGYTISLIAVSASGESTIDTRDITLNSSGQYLFAGTYTLPDGDYTSYKLVLRWPLRATAGTTTAGQSKTVVSTIQMDTSFGAYTFEVDEDEEIVGLLDGIIGWIKNIFNALADLPANIASSVSGFFTNVVNAVGEVASSVANKFTSIFDSWFDTDTDLDNAVSSGSNIVDDVGNAESDLMQDALDGVNSIDFDAGFSTQLVTALFWLLPYQDRLFNSFGLVKDVIVVALTVGLVTLLLGRGYRALGNYNSGSSGGNHSYHDSGAPRLKG